MKNKLMINHKDRLIVMDRTFAMNAMNTMSDEYEHLQRVRADYPKYEVIQRHIRQNEQKKTYKGLTYEYMEDYIMTHGTSEQIKANLKEFYEKRLIAECHGKAYRYPVIKRWFLEKFPEIVEHGMMGLSKPAKVIEIFGGQDEEEEAQDKSA